MNTNKRKWVPLYPRIDKNSWAIYFEGGEWVAHLAWRPDPATGKDRFIFTCAKNVLGEEEGERFKQDLTRILRYMWELNRLGETTKRFVPFIKLYWPTYQKPPVEL